MAEEDQVPEWARELAQALADTLELGSFASLDCKQSGPEETEWGVDLVEVWPALLEIQEAGPNDGEIVYGIVHRFDILSAQEIFDKVDTIQFGFALTGQPKITFEAWFNGRPVVVIVYFEPEFDEDEEDE